ncbi:hypothetical protein RP20_CCG011461 [Aedes albopictus]|nr:hypothetical protein RP20_CCG011461 [Aedes albopictus]
MLIDSRMPKNMWCEAALTATYLINRSPTAAIPENVTPAERWMKAKPDVGKLRIFGCKAYAWVPSQLRKKLDDKSREAVMIGYAPNGYRLWDRSSRKVFIARDVRFDETCLPFATKEDEAGNDLLVIPIRYEQEGENRDAVDVVDAGFQDNVEVTDDEYEEAENPSGDERNEFAEEEPNEAKAWCAPFATKT